MKTLSTYLIAAVAACALFSFAGFNAYAGGGREKVEAAKAKGIPVFVDFGKTSCKPCKMMVPVLEALTQKYKGTMEVVFVHVDDERDYALKMGATMIPTQVLIDKTGKEVSRHVGYIPVEDCEKMIAGVAAPASAQAPAKPVVPAKKKTTRKEGSCGSTCSTGAVCK